MGAPTLRFWGPRISIPTGAWDAEDRAAELYDHLRDDLTGSRFGWGELRDGDNVVPGPRPRDDEKR